jgi:PST family polysaccharide transporter
MAPKVKNKFRISEENSRLGKNIFSLGLLQVANYVLPLLTVPYLVRVLGPEYFGLLAFATATIAYFVLITDYGFNLTATRQISIHREDAGKVNQIFSSVMIIKLGLVVVGLLPLCLLVLSFEKFSEYWQVFFISYGIVVGQALFPLWLFQGMESMKYISILNIATKALFTICIFVFVEEQSDYLLVPLMNSLGFILSGIWALYVLRTNFDVKFEWQSLDAIKSQLKDGWHVSISSVSTSMYTTSTTFILGLLTNNLTVGYFAGAHKIVQAARGLYGPVSQAIYPLISKKIDLDRHAGLEFVRKVLWLVGGATFILSLLLFVFAESITNLLLGPQFGASVVFLKIMSFVPFIIALSNMFGIQMMLNLGYQKSFTRILVTAGVIGIILSLSLTMRYEALGTSVAILAIELMVTVWMYAFLKFRVKVFR